jgi:hypothetical protein
VSHAFRRMHLIAALSRGGTPTAACADVDQPAGHGQSCWTRMTISGTLEGEERDRVGSTALSTAASRLGPCGWRRERCFHVCTRCAKREFLSGGQPRPTGYDHL